MGLILRLAERAQPLLDAKKFSRIDALCADPRPARALALVRRRILADGAFFPCWMVLRNMEHLTAEFPRLLDRVNHAEPPDDFDVRFPAQAENLLVYFLFRYVLKAVNDGRLLPRVESCLFHVVALRYLCGTADAQTYRNSLSFPHNSSTGDTPQAAGQSVPPGAWTPEYRKHPHPLP